MIHAPKPPAVKLIRKTTNSKVYLLLFIAVRMYFIIVLFAIILLFLNTELF